MATPKTCSTPGTAIAVKNELLKLVNHEKANFYPRFFKTGKGEYGEGDQFLGVVVPDQRRIARKPAFQNLPLDEVKKLLADPYHECRLTALFILVGQFESADNAAGRKKVCDFYLAQLDRVNNWDLVDSSAHKILGPQLEQSHYRRRLNQLADSGDLWRQRVAVIATLHLIKIGEFGLTLELCERFLDHAHDLIHKATGWMLREIGKQDQQVLAAFLNRFHKKMPRAMLRYAIEHFDPNRRKKWM
jgi:3-methyladenine DNA glycosylase AlkD